MNEWSRLSSQKSSGEGCEYRIMFRLPSLAHLFSDSACAKSSALASRETNQRCEVDIKAKVALCQDGIFIVFGCSGHLVVTFSKICLSQRRRTRNGFFKQFTNLTTGITGSTHNTNSSLTFFRLNAFPLRTLRLCESINKGPRVRPAIGIKRSKG